MNKQQDLMMQELRRMQKQQEASLGNEGSGNEEVKKAVEEA